MEIWKDIPEYEGYYQASNLGRIRRYGVKNIIKPILTRDGYHRISLSKKGVIKNKFVHRLVAETFINNTEDKPFINHKDGNKQNNEVDNLEWVTSNENTLHSYRLGLQSKQGEKNNQSILKDFQVREIKSRVLSARELATKFGVSIACVNAILTGVNWKHIK